MKRISQLKLEKNQTNKTKPSTGKVKMPNPLCADPFGSHSKQVIKNLRPVTSKMVETGFVENGQNLCDRCRKEFFEQAAKRAKEADAEQSAADSSISTSQSQSQPGDLWNANEAKREQFIPAINTALSAMGESPVTASK